MTSSPNCQPRNPSSSSSPSTGTPRCSGKDIQITRLVDHNLPDVSLPVGTVRSVKSLAYDYEDGKIYWVDGKLKAVRRAAISSDNSNSKVTNYMYLQYNGISSHKSE